MEQDLDLHTQNLQEGDNQPIPPKPANNLALAIVTTVCCCLPLGIVAILKAVKVNEFYIAKQYGEAEQAAADAKKWSLIGIGIGIVIYIIYIALYGTVLTTILNK
jgi:hypothetical protein